MSVQLKFKVVDKTYTGDQLTNKYREILILAIRSLLIPTIDWINKYVPKRTGQLRDSLINWINDHWIVDDVGLKASLNTDVEYAFDISGDASHKGTWYEHSGAPAVAYYYNNYGRIFLDDPQAITMWSGLMASFLNSEFNKNIISYKENLLGG